MTLTSGPSAARPLALHHLAVVVADLARAEAFYSGVLSLPVVERWTDLEGRPRSVWVGLGAGAFLAIEVGSGGRGRDEGAPGWHCVALAINPSEREAWRTRLAGADVRVERESDFTLYVRDPDGNLIGLSHYPESASSATRGASRAKSS